MVIEWEKAASAAYDVISLLLNDEITAGKNGVISWVKEKIYRRKIQKYCRAFFKNHNGTVLTNPVFLQFLQNYKTIERLFNYTGNTHADLTDEEYLDSELETIKGNIEYPVTGSDLTAIRSFLSGLLIKHREYREKCLSGDSRQIIQNDDRNTKKIIDCFESIGEEKKSELFEAITSKGTLTVNQEDNIFQVLDNSFWKGDFDLLKSIQPVLHEKSDSLDVWLNIVLSRALLKSDSYRIYKSVNSIEHPNIREDAVRKIIIFSYLQNKKYVPEEFEVSGDLKELITKLQSGDKWLFNETKELKDNVDCYNLTPFLGLNAERETIKRLQVISVYDKGIWGVAAVIDSIIGNMEVDFITGLLKRVRHYTDSLTVCDTEEQAIQLSKAVFNELWDKKELYSCTNRI